MINVPQPKFKIVTTKRNWFENAKDKQTAYIQAEKKLDRDERIMFNLAWNLEAKLSGE